MHQHRRARTGKQPDVRDGEEGSCRKEGEVEVVVLTDWATATHVWRCYVVPARSGLARLVGQATDHVVS